MVNLSGFYYVVFLEALEGVTFLATSNLNLYGIIIESFRRGISFINCEAIVNFTSFEKERDVISHFYMCTSVSTAPSVVTCAIHILVFALHEFHSNIPSILKVV